MWINHVNGHWQHEWRGPRLVNIRVFVCGRCLDKPFIFNKPIIYPPDPVPIKYAFPENFSVANNGSPFVPPLPWPSHVSGPVVPMPPTPEYPVYVTPPLPPLPPEIEEGGFSEP